MSLHVGSKEKLNGPAKTPLQAHLCCAVSWASAVTPLFCCLMPKDVRAAREQPNLASLH